MTDFLQITTTAGSRDEAERIAAALVERRLAGCVQIVGPVRSVYRWQGAVEQAEEWLCLIKTNRRSLCGRRSGDPRAAFVRVPGDHRHADRSRQRRRICSGWPSKRNSDG